MDYYIYDVFLNGEYVGDYTKGEIEKEFGIDSKQFRSHILYPRLKGYSFVKVDTKLSKSHQVFRQWNKLVKSLRKSRKGGKNDRTRRTKETASVGSK